MDNQERLRQRVDRWEEAFQRGTPLSPEELCQDCPEILDDLRQWIAALQGTAWLCQPLDQAAASTQQKALETVATSSSGRRILGDYEVLDEIGSGGMGKVYRAVHRTMHRLVALKVLSPCPPESLQRFEREVQAVARLSHPNIVVAHDAGACEGTHFLVMELIDGDNLARLVQEHGPLPVEAAVDCILQAARGLEYAHAAGIIHRDIKPSNLLLDKAGVVKILDLGLARIQTDEARFDLTASNRILGTVDYMAPEQAANTRRADHRSDIYSLGCTLYYLLTGQPIYGGETTMERLLAHREQPIPSLRQVAPGVSSTLDAIFQQMLAKRPEGRYPSMSEVIAALEKCSLTAETPLPSPSRWRWWASVAAAVGLLAITWPVWSLLKTPPEPSPKAPSSSETQPSSTSESPKPSFPPIMDPYTQKTMDDAQAKLAKAMGESQKMIRQAHELESQLRNDATTRINRDQAREGIPTIPPSTAPKHSDSSITGPNGESPSSSKPKPIARKTPSPSAPQHARPAEDSVPVQRITFTTPDSMDKFLPMQKAEIKDRTLVLSDGRALCKQSWRSIESVVVVGKIVSEDNANFRIAVGPVQMILNGKSPPMNSFRNTDHDETTRTPLPHGLPAGGVKDKSVEWTTWPSALSRGRMHQVSVVQKGDFAVVEIDGKGHYRTAAHLAGTVCVYPQDGSTIAIRSITVTGIPDTTKKVTEPSHPLW